MKLVCPLVVSLGYVVMHLLRAASRQVGKSVALLMASVLRYAYMHVKRMQMVSVTAAVDVVLFGSATAATNVA